MADTAENEGERDTNPASQRFGDVRESQRPMGHQQKREQDGDVLHKRSNPQTAQLITLLQVSHEPVSHARHAIEVHIVPLRSAQPREAIGAPLFASHAMMGEKQTVGIILLFHRR